MSEHLCPKGHPTEYQSFSGGQEWYCRTCDENGQYEEAKAAALDVFVVQVGPTGLWEANCCSPLCGPGLHGVAEDLKSKKAAESAANVHRAFLRGWIDRENDHWDRLAARGDPVSLEVIRLRRQLEEAEKRLAVYERLYGPLPNDELNTL